MLMLVLCIAALGLSVLTIGIWMKYQTTAFEKQMKTSFQSLSFEVLERSSRSFLDLARSTFESAQKTAQSDLDLKQKNLEALLEPLRETMKSLAIQQRELEIKREGAYATLHQQIEHMTQIEVELRKETSQLSSALRSPSVRGAWGQVHLRRVVELAGLRNQCDFSEQSTHELDGKLLRPDLVVHLPGNRHVIVDAKTPLNAYFEVQEILDEATRVKKLQLHLSYLRKHMKELSQKDYWKRFDLSPEFVVLFLPAESFFSDALQADPSIIEAGAEQNIILATPTTLIAILRSIALSWKQEAISKNTEQIALLGQELFERLVVLSEHWNKVGRSLSAAVDGYNQSIASLESRVLIPARKLKDLGAAPINKELLTLEPINQLIRGHSTEMTK